MRSANTVSMIAWHTGALDDPLEFAQLFERIDADVGVRADADSDATGAHALDR